MPKMGNTVRLKAKFYDIEGTAQNLDGDNAKLTVYNSKRTVIEGPADCISGSETGEYYYDYTVPISEGDLYWEIKGDLGGKQVLTRQILQRTWAK